MSKSVAQLDERAGVFDTLRKALRIALPEGNNGLNDDGDGTDMKTIEERVKGFENKSPAAVSYQGKTNTRR